MNPKVAPHHEAHTRHPTAPGRASPGPPRLTRGDAQTFNRWPDRFQTMMSWKAILSTTLPSTPAEPCPCQSCSARQQHAISRPITATGQEEHSKHRSCARYCRARRQAAVPASAALRSNSLQREVDHTRRHPLHDTAGRACLCRSCSAQQPPALEFRQDCFSPL